MTDQHNQNPSPSTDVPDGQPTSSSGPTGTLGELPEQPLGLPGVAGVPAQSPSQSPGAPSDQEQDAQLDPDE